MRGCGKVLVIDFDKLSHRGGKRFSFPRTKGRKIVWGKLFIVTSALKSQRRVRCEFGVVSFIEIDFALREIN